MKYSIAYLLIIFFLFACKANPGETLLKKWRPVDARGAVASEEAKKDLLQEGNAMEFLKDGKFVAFAPGVENDTGSYQLLKDGTELRIMDSESRITIFTVEEIKWNHLLLEKDGLVLVLKPLH